MEVTEDADGELSIAIELHSRIVNSTALRKKARICSIHGRTKEPQQLHHLHDNRKRSGHDEGDESLAMASQEEAE